MSPREWEQRKDEFIGRQQASTPPIQGPAEMRTGSPEEGGEYYGFRMGIGCLTGILTFFLVFWIAYLTYNAIA